VGIRSDHTVFLNHLGRPTVCLEFDGQYGVCHSGYDDHYWMTHFGDPDFQYHIVISKLWGLLALRLANAEVLPYDFEAYAASIHDFLADLDSKSKLQQHLDLVPLNAAIEDFQQAAQDLNPAVGKALADGILTPDRARRLNESLAQVEGNWLNAGGIPGRPWFRHLLYAARYAVYVCASGASGVDGGGGEGRLEDCERTGGVVEGGIEERYGVVAKSCVEVA